MSASSNSANVEPPAEVTPVAPARGAAPGRHADRGDCFALLTWIGCMVLVAALILIDLCLRMLR
jgi:hypothetical protein